MKINQGDNCECGRRLPWHLLDLFDERGSHVCYCERLYKKTTDGEVVLDGTAPNPHARLDGAVLG